MATGTTAEMVAQRRAADQAWLAFNILVSSGLGGTETAQALWEEWDRLERAITAAEVAGRLERERERAEAEGYTEIAPRVFIREEPLRVPGRKGSAEADTLYWRQMAHGMCSDSECDQPIAHTCCVCGKRICAWHSRHLMADNYECIATPHYGEDR